MGRHMMVEALFLALLCGTALRGVSSGRALLQDSKVKVLVYYVHDSASPLNATFVTVAGQNNNLTFQGFGQTGAVDEPIKLGPEENSTVIGFAAAISTTTNHPGVSHVSSAHTLNDTTLGVGRLEILTNADLSQPLKISELVIAGGTGDFAFYQGIASAEIVYFAPPILTFKITATLVKYY